MKVVVGLVLVLRAFSAAENIPGTLGKTVKINCGALTSDVEVKWEHEGQIIFRLPRRGPLVKGRAAMVPRSKLRMDLLEISRVEAADAGLYTCTVDGKPHRHRLYIVSVTVHPSKTLQLGSNANLQCQVKGLQPPPTVEWERPDGTSVREETVQLKSVSRSDKGAWSCKFSYEGTMYNKTFKVTVEEAVVSTSATPEDLKKSKCTKDPGSVPEITKTIPNEKILGLSLWIWIALGVGPVVLIMVLIIVILICRRAKRMKRRVQKLKTLRNPQKSGQYCQCKCPAAAVATPQGQQRGKPLTLLRQQR